MANGSVMAWEQVTGPKGHEALRGFLDGDAQASEKLLSVIDAANAGEYDKHYAGNPDARVLVTTSCHLMVLTVINRLKGVNTSGFYKDDLLRYVRLNCLIQRMLGIERLTLGWQRTMYSPAQSIGPGKSRKYRMHWRARANHAPRFHGPVTYISRIPMPNAY